MKFRFRVLAWEFSFSPDSIPSEFKPCSKISNTCANKPVRQDCCIILLPSLWFAARCPMQYPNQLLSSFYNLPRWQLIATLCRGSPMEVSTSCPAWVFIDLTTRESILHQWFLTWIDYRDAKVRNELWMWMSRTSLFESIYVWSWMDWKYPSASSQALSVRKFSRGV